MKRSPSWLNVSEFGQIYASVIGSISEYEAVSCPVKAEFNRIGRSFRDERTKAVVGFVRSKNGYPTTALTASMEAIVQYELISRGSVVSSKISGGLEDWLVWPCPRSGGSYSVHNECFYRISGCGGDQAGSICTPKKYQNLGGRRRAFRSDTHH